MAESQPLGGGRGRKLLDYLKSKSTASEDSSPGHVGRIPVEEEPPSEPRSVGSGRGALIGLALSKPKPSAIDDTALASAVRSDASDMKPSSLGRGRLFAGARNKLTETEQVGSVGRGLFRRPAENVPPAPRSEVSLDTARSEGTTRTSQTCKTTRTECDIEKELELLSLEDEKGPIVKRGESGKEMKVTANYVKLYTDPGKGVFEFEVRFEPDIDYSHYRFKIVNSHIKSRRGIRCYDGGDKLYMPEKITDDRLVFDTKHPNDSSPVRLIIKFKREMRLRECSQLYNVLFNNCSKVLNFARLGRQFYDAKSSHTVPQHKLEVWPGYVTSVEEFEGGVFLNCDIVHRVLRTETPYTIIKNIISAEKDYKVHIEKQLLGECVLTRYNNNLYRIDDIEWDMTPMSKFTLSNGTELTFLEYYKKNYNLDIRDGHQPLLVNRAKKHKKDEQPQLICLVPELCYMTGLTDQMRSDFKVMKDIATYTRVTPAQRQLAFTKFMDRIKTNEESKQMLNDWGLRIADEPEMLDARILQPEPIIFGKNMQIPGQVTAEWMKDSRSKSVLRAVHIRSWVFVYTRRDARRAEAFASLMRKVGPGMGVDIFDPTNVTLNDDRIDSFLRGLKENISKETQIVVCLCPTKRDDRYAAIKKLCCREIPIPSQVVNSGTIAREDKMRPIVQNIALQMNNKLGGASWGVQVPMKNTMICGIDTYHDAGRKGNSVGAFVASIDPMFSTWFSRTCIQNARQELIDGIVQCFVAALRKYLQMNGQTPDRIVIFRDGVGDGQLKICREHEVQQFLEACRLVNPEYLPKITVVIVQKRINTRFFRHVGRNELENSLPGGVLDHTVTRRNYYDFFLVSQHVRQGTATPSHYIVLYDNSNLPPDHLQRLAYKFCHLYYNWPGTIRVPAPCQYAHKLAYLIGQSVKGLPDPKLEDKLYYL